MIEITARWPRALLASRVAPVLPFALYALYCSLRSDLRAEHLIVLAIVAALASATRWSRDLLYGLYPLGLVFLLYDGMRPMQRWGLSEGRVLVCDLRALDSRLFGFSDGTTLHDYFQQHTSLALDLMCAVPYATFILWSAIGGVFLYVKDRPAMRRFMWGFFFLNVAGFVTYHVLPAAPPWYYHAHGCAVDLATKASEGPRLARVDAFLGVGYFHAMYGKASSVFGALPSLHCAYPLLLLMVGYRSFGPWLRVFAALYYAAMVFSAVYLDHHWVIDAVLGSAYAIATAALMTRVFRAREARVASLAAVSS